MKVFKMRSLLFAFVIFGIGLLVGCGSESESSGSDGDASSDDSSDLTSITHVLNWFAQPAHAGNYAALQQGFYEDVGLDVEIEEGGPQVSATQIVASGNAEFGIANADEVLMAVDEGLPLVAVAAAFQDTQQAFAFHKGQPIEEIEDFNGREVFVTPGAGYWEYLKQEYDLSDVKELAHTGSLLSFMDNEEAVAQIFAASEPFILEDEGVDIDMLYLKDTGYSLYFNVIFTTESVIEEKPEAVDAFVKASIDGWDYYNESEENAEEVNGFLKEANSDLDMEQMAQEAEAQKEYMFAGDEERVGYMNEEKWTHIKDILTDIDVIKGDFDVKDVFTTEFLPYE